MAALFVAATLIGGCAASATPEPAESASVGGTLRLNITPEQQKGFEPLIAEFEESSGVTVDVEAAPTDALSQQLQIQLSSGTAADIFRTGVSGTVGVKLLAGEGYLEDLSGETWAARVPDSFKPLLSVDDGLYAYPASAQGIAMFYNKAVFEEHNVDVPTTWSEFIDVCKTLKDAGVVPIASGLAGGGGPIQFIPYMLAATLVAGQTPQFDDDLASGEAKFAESKEWHEVLDKTFSLYEDGYVNADPLGTPPENAMKSVGAGEAAMIALPTSTMPTLAENFADGIDGVGIFALPATNDPDETWVPISPDVDSVNIAGANVPAAKAFLEFVSTPERASQYATAAGAIPALTGSEPVDTEVGNLLTKYLDDGKSAPFAVHRWPNPEVQQTFIASGQLVISGDLSVEELLEQMDAAYRAPN